MAGIRVSNTILCIAASVALCGAPALAQSTMGAPANQQTTPSSGSGASSSGSMQGSAAGSMQDNSSTAAGSDSKVSSEDKKFLETAMEGDMAEIQLGQLALQKASSDQVKQFAQHMIDDHTKLSEQMKPIAQQLGVEAPASLSSKHLAVQAKLQGLSGAEFDREYIKDMVADHSEDDQAFVRETTSAKDPTLKNAVSQAEPIIAGHLKMAQDLEKSTKGNGSM